MQFVYPGFLFALSALSIPVIIHLFNFRRFKKIYFTNVRFLQEIKQDTRSRSRLKYLLILAARILAVTFLVLAFAQPFLPAKNTMVVAGMKSVSVYIDNSFSMDAVGKNGSLIESAKKKAREIASAFQPSDRFQLLTNDFEARHQRLTNREEFLKLVDEVKSSAPVRKLSEVISRQQDAMKGNEHPKQIALYEISDFQKSISNLEEIKSDSNVRITLVPVEATEIKNVYIDTGMFSMPFVQLNNPNELTVRIRNLSGETVESVPVKLLVNGTQRSLASVTVPAGSSAEAKMTFSITQPGWQQAEISITDYPVTFDDSYFLSFEVKANLSVLSINESQHEVFIDALFKNDPYFVLKNSPVQQIDYSSFPSNNLIVLSGLKELSSGLSQELKKYLDKGGAVILFPSAEADVPSYNNFFQAVKANTMGALNDAEEKVSYIETRHPLFSDVFEKKKPAENLDLPIVHRSYSLNKSVSSASSDLMRLQSGLPFLTATPVGKGVLYCCASPLAEEFSNFPKHALFVPFMLKAAMSGFNTATAPLTIGRNNEVEIPSLQPTGETVLHLTNSEKKFDIIPESRIISTKPFIAVHDQIREAGNYSLLSGNQIIAVLSFNYDRRESDLRCYTIDELKSLAEKSGLHNVELINGSQELTHAIARQNEGTHLWKYCVWLALLFLACEIALIRFLRTSTKFANK